MNEKEQKKLEVGMTVTFDNKEDLKEFVESFGKALGKKQAEALIALAEEGFKEDEIPNVFQPQKGDICTCVIDDKVDTIFRYDGKTRTDEDGTVWIDGDLSLTWSGDLFKPYQTIIGEGAECIRDCCRPATEEEIALFRGKLKDHERAGAKKGKTWKVGEWGYMVGSGTGCSQVFYTVPVTYADTKTMGNLVRRGWVFDKEEDCEAFCDKLNEAIKNVK